MQQREYIFYVYILASRSRNLYVGMTNDIAGRVRQHRELRPETYTARYRITRQVHFERFTHVLNAICPREGAQRLEPGEKARAD
jgi:putative endonuclease